MRCGNGWDYFDDVMGCSNGCGYSGGNGGTRYHVPHPYPQVFHEVAYKARQLEDLLAGLDEFMNKATVLPPGQWDPAIRLDPPSNIPSQASRLAIQEVPRPARQVSTAGGGGGGGGGGPPTKVEFYKM